MNQVSKEPLCKLRAESLHQNFLTIEDFRISSVVKIPNDYFNLNETPIENFHSADYDTEFETYLKVNLENINSYLFMTFNDELKNYFIKNYEISSLEDIKDINCTYTIHNENKIKIDDKIIVGVKDINCISKKIIGISHKNEEHKNKAKKIANKLVDKHIKDINESLKKSYLKEQFVGEAKIKNYKNKIKNNRHHTILTVSNGKNEIEFDLEYPLFYDANDETVEFINKVGGGSVQGLKNESVYIVPETEIENSPARTNGLAITGNERNNTDYESILVSKIFFSFILISYGIFWIGIIAGIITLAFLAMAILLFITAQWSIFNYKYVD